MGPRKQSKTENGEHQSPIYLKHVSNFKASLRRRDSARFLRTKGPFSISIPDSLREAQCTTFLLFKYHIDDLTCQTWEALPLAQNKKHSQSQSYL
uniref:Uncharacterized protein n=1 Tax=Daphnia galeata TaxID=27404 RepID=A0A8J2RQ51_9CRUS|nr:unnamed protein product [Daphnia galeata]